MAGKLPSEVHYYASVINCPAYANNAAYKAVLAPVLGTAASLLPAFQSPVPRVRAHVAKRRRRKAAVAG